jgi:hypothetical protein
MTSRKKSFLLIAGLQFALMAGAQDFSGLIQPNYTLEEIITILEERHSTRIFYEAGWFENNSFSPHVVELPLELAVSNIITGGNLTFIYVDGYIVIIPLEAGTGHVREHDTLLLTIGNPSEFGRSNYVVLKGRILDGTTGESLPGAVIYSEKSGRGSPADKDGRYSITLPAGELMIRLSYVGYENQFRRINLFGPGEQDFYLFEETQRIDEVTIMARRAEANISRTQMSMISMDSRKLKELPSNLGEQDIIKSMTLLPGVQSVGEFGTGIHVRGGSSDQNLILLENVPLFNSSHLFGLISVVNPDMVSEMTLFKGGIPAKYGERVSSVMDIRVNPGNIEEFKIIGGIGLINSRLHLEAPVLKDRINLSVGGRSSYSNWILEKIPAEDLMNSSAGFYDISTLLSVTPNQSNSISLFAYNSDDRFSSGEATEYGYSNTLASMKWNRILSGKLSINMAGGFSMYDYNIRDTGHASPAGAFLLNSGVDYRSLKGNLLWFPDGNHRVESGVNVIRYGISPGNLRPLDSLSLVQASQIDKEKGIEFSLFVSDGFDISDRISTEIGLRYSRYMYLGPASTYLYDEHYPRDREYITDTLTFGKNETAAGYGGFEPRLSFRLNLTGSSSLKASYTRNNQYINLVSNTAVITPSDVWKLSDHHLKPLRSDHIAVGYFRNLFNNSIETSAEIYFKKLTNIKEYKEGAELLMNHNIETDLINAKGQNYGIELYAGRNSGRLTGWLSYTFSSSKVRSDSDKPREQINNNNYFPSNYDKPHEITLNAGYNISRRWRMGATFNYNSGRPVTLPEMYFTHGNNQLVYYSDRNKYRLPAYHRLDISITRKETLKLNKRGSGFWAFSLLNAYGRKNPYSVFYEKEITGPLERDSFNLYKLYIIGRPMPTLTYNFIF